MIVSYLKIALRYLAKNKVYSSINIAGLTLSLACALLMILYTKDEFSFDKFQKDIHSIYLIAIDVQYPDGSSFEKMGVTSMLHGPRFKDVLPELESFVRLKNTYKDVKLAEDINTQKVLEADNNFFSFFTFPLIEGDPETALRNIHSIVISGDMAIRHFGKTNVLNNTILLEREGSFLPYTITGVAKRCPQNSSIQFEAVIPLQEKDSDLNWLNVSLSTFVKLNDGSDVNAVSSKMQKIFEGESGKAMEQAREYGFTQSFHHQLQPFAAIHLSEDFIAEAGLTNASSPIYSYILSGIAVFILVIACINFINLTIARSVKRAKEIGIRKVVGGGRQQLIGQFLGESFLLSLISFIAALGLARLLLPLFNDLVNKELSLSYLMDSKLISIYVALLLFTGLVAGFYPAVVLSGYSPVKTLYSRFRLSPKNYLQKALIIFQFALATFMVVATVTVYLQFDYLTTRDLGYDPEDVVKVTKRNLTQQEAVILSDRLFKHPDILFISPQRHGSENGKINSDSILHFAYEAVNEKFMDVLKIELMEGRNFSSLYPSDSAKSVVINEAFAKKAGWKEPIGQQVKMMDGATCNVIGIVKDYHYESLKKTIEPQLFSLAFNLHNPSYEHVLIRIQPNSEARSIPFIEKTFKELFPMHPYTYQFCNDINLMNYEAESKWKQVILLSAFLTIFIAGIGLFGLSILTAENRFKEIGIRKVLGATVTAIVVTLYKDHLSLVSLALLVAIPTAYYASIMWLDKYPYRTEVSAGIFIGAGLFVFVIAGVTISYQTIKTALLNPVDSLRTE